MIPFIKLVDWSVRHETPAGKAWPGKTPQECSDEEASGPPAESECLQRKSTSTLENGLFQLFYSLFILVASIFFLHISLQHRMISKHMYPQDSFFIHFNYFKGIVSIVYFRSIFNRWDIPQLTNHKTA